MTHCNIIIIYDSLFLLFFSFVPLFPLIRCFALHPVYSTL